MKKIFSLFAALTLSVGLWAAAPVVGDQFLDEDSGLKFEVTAVGETNTVKVYPGEYTKTSYTVPSMVTYKEVEFAVTAIGESAFQGCSSLQSITLPASVTEIEISAFKGTGLTSITLPEDLTTIGGAAFMMCSGLQSITIPAGVTEIGVSTFFQCSSLASITLPEGLTTIGTWAFVMSGLISISIPASVTTIEEGAFANCASLAAVTLEGNSCQEGIADDAFTNVGATAPALLTLPKGWTGTKPDEDGNWYGGKFELAEDPTTLPQMRAAVKTTKVMTNGQVIFRAENKNYTILGQEK